MKYLLDRCVEKGVHETELLSCALAAYNYGEGNVFAQIAKMGGKFVWDIVKSKVPIETKTYRRRIGMLINRLRGR